MIQRNLTVNLEECNYRCEIVKDQQIVSDCDYAKHHKDINANIGVWITIAALFILSFLEMVLEACVEFMPYHQIFKPIYTYMCIYFCYTDEDAPTAPTESELSRAWPGRADSVEP